MSEVARLRCDGCLRIFAAGASPLAARVVAKAAGCLIDAGRELCFDCAAHARALARAEPLAAPPITCPACGRPAGAAAGCPVSVDCHLPPLQRRSRRHTAAAVRIYRRAA